MSIDSKQADTNAAAVEAAVPTSVSDTAAQKQERARNAYLVWRNANLGSLPPAAFAQVEASSGALISAIVEIL